MTALFRRLSIAGQRSWRRGADGTTTGSDVTLLDRIRTGDLRLLPVIVGLVVISLVFQSQNDRFLSPQNLSNLAVQIAPGGLLAIGLFLVLVVAEIDLSVGVVSGVCGAVLAVLNVHHAFDPLAAMVMALVAGAAIGTVHGLIVTKVGVPAFIVTLAGLIGWQGALILILGREGTMNIQRSIVTDLTWTFLPTWLAWTGAAAIVLVYVGSTLRSRAARSRAGLPIASASHVARRVVILSAALVATVALLMQDRGVPTALVILAGLCAGTELFIKRTRYGRYVFAVGGNKEAARRAGIPVERVRLFVMIAASVFAAAGGVLFASRLMAVSAESGSGETLLISIAAVVIGGTSLYGGRGTAYAALLGMLVIGSISNGMDLLSLNSSVKLMITGVVLLVAVGLDALARRKQ